MVHKYNRDRNNSKSTSAHNKQKDKDSSKDKAGSNGETEQRWSSVHTTFAPDDSGR